MTAFLRRSAPLLFALACLCAGGGPAAAQNRDSTLQQPPITHVPGAPQQPEQQTPREQPPADTPVARPPSRTRPAVQIPSVQLPGVRLPSARPRTVAVPSLSGRTLADARRILSGAGLTLGEVAELPVERPAGTVFLQRPAAGTQVQRGATVAVTLAQAPARTAIMPNVMDQSLGEAVRRVQAAGLRVGSVEGASGRLARVSGQSYTPGQRVPVGAEVALSMAVPATPVAAARPPVQPPAQQPAQQPVPQTPQLAARVDSVAVPDVAGLTLANAWSALEGAGLAADVDPALVDSASWTVASQLPAPGAHVPAGSGVGLALAAPPAPAAATQAPVVPPPVASGFQAPRTPEPAPAIPAEASRKPLPWPWILLAIIVLAAAAAVTRRVRAGAAGGAAAPVAVSARVRGEAHPRVEVRGAPFTAAPRLRMRTRTEAPVLAATAAGPLFTNHGGAGD